MHFIKYADLMKRTDTGVKEKSDDPSINLSLLKEKVECLTKQQMLSLSKIYTDLQIEKPKLNGEVG